MWTDSDCESVVPFGAELEGMIELCYYVIDSADAEEGWCVIVEAYSLGMVAVCAKGVSEVDSVSEVSETGSVSSV